MPDLRGRFGHEVAGGESGCGWGGDGGYAATTVAITVDAPTEAETHDETGNPKTTAGRRLSLASTSSGSASSDAAQAHVTARATASTTVTLRRATDGASLSAWVQAVDLAGLTYSQHAIHVTRSVLDLRDQVVAVWDARGLSAPTWTFAHDALGRPLAAVHSTGLGPRYTLPDAANNPMWSRDARGVEVDRTFDALDRPLTENSDDGGGAVLRRLWRYVAYDALDPDFTAHQADNLFGAVEEARDADGLRVFRYDHRGLPLAVTHRFWPQRDGDDKPWDDATSALWSAGSSWAPALPDAPRASLTDWLALDGLTASTEVLIEATYDAAGRPVRMDYPEGMATRLSYDEGGRLSRVEVDRGAGGGFFDALASVDYDARGKATKLVFGNGVQTVREHDEALERLTRLYTKLPGTPDVEHQDLRYAYDPAGHVLNIEDALSESSFKDNKLVPNSRGFTYDARYRLIRATGRKHNTVFDRSTGVLVPSPDENDYVPYDLRYAYDEVGNFRINQEYASSGKAHLNYKAGRIDLFNGRNAEADDARPEHGNFRYDANGSVTHTPRQQELGYAFDGQPVYVDLGGGGKARYFRHGDQRVVRMVNKPGVMAVGVYLGPWEYHSRQGTVSFEKVVLHVHGEGKVAQVERVLDGADPDSLAVFYVHEDHLGSGHVLTDGDGELLSQEEYFAYGRSSDRRDARNRYRWIGVERDEDTGLCLTGPRLYDPVVGRLGSGDPVVRAGRSPFGYAGGEPIGRRDPGGYQDQPAARGGPDKRAADHPSRRWRGDGSSGRAAPS
jgi:RHS repeat-associated protein